MKYRTNTPYEFDKQNESRADRAEWALAVSTDRNGETDVGDTYLDISDLVGNLMAFCDRTGIAWDDVCAHGERGYEGDSEDGPRAVRDTDRFPDS